MTFHRCSCYLGCEGSLCSTHFSPAMVFQTKRASLSYWYYLIYWKDAVCGHVFSTKPVRKWHGHGKANGMDINSIGNATGPETAEQNESAPHMEGTFVVYTAMTTATSQNCWRHNMVMIWSNRCFCLLHFGKPAWFPKEISARWEFSLSWTQWSFQGRSGCRIALYSWYQATFGHQVATVSNQRGNFLAYLQR